MGTLYLLFECASGYGLFERSESEVIGRKLEDVQASVTDVSRFSKMVSLKAFVPFKSAEEALENANSISEGLMHETLKNFLEMNVKSGKKKSKCQLGVVDPKIGNAVQESLEIPCVCDDVSLELIRGIRAHCDHFFPELKKGDIERAQLGLGHSYSRTKVRFNVNKADNMIIQSIALLDQLDKDLNTFAMRIKEWYSWHFPELARIVSDNYVFARLAKYIRSRSTLNEERLAGVEEITGDAIKAKEVYDAAKASMGTDISEMDMINIEMFADRVIKLAEYRQRLHTYLQDKMEIVAPNLSTLIGEQVAARLISHAGSLTNLAKAPASTVQILGAEKALFRALKTKGNTPKYGLIYHSVFISKATPKDKGRISRYLANKCSIASRIDAFSETTTRVFGEKLKEQVEERLNFYATGTEPRKNQEVMSQAMAAASEVAAAQAAAAADKKKKKKEKKAKKEEAAEDTPAAPAEETSEKKKKKKRTAEEAEIAEATPEADGAAEGEKKKKKKKKSESS